ncbi:hypothetical protein CHU_2934 [Cytophaga hutchinsonii ATCC 33406]|uniref:Uncharacterized protein n=2 Tax=Cytophaga hutchinsonii TaxID=985 RepID=A0A6N4SV29_CYTH3|nr:hypothetical protein CHU_2934 [Cytophaga hutchinsonii ATCC 33406]
MFITSLIISIATLSYIFFKTMQIELPTNLKLFKMPPSAEVMLFLISEEMKINRLVEAGFDAAYTCDLSTLILSLAGFEYRPDSLYDGYTELLDKHCEKVSPMDEEEWKDALLDMYMQIKIETGNE